MLWSRPTNVKIRKHIESWKCHNFQFHQYRRIIYLRITSLNVWYEAFMPTHFNKISSGHLTWLMAREDFIKLPWANGEIPQTLQDFCSSAVRLLFFFRTMHLVFSDYLETATCEMLQWTPFCVQYSLMNACRYKHFTARHLAVCTRPNISVTLLSYYRVRPRT
jgi:hypothetical protein